MPRPKVDRVAKTADRRAEEEQKGYCPDLDVLGKHGKKLKDNTLKVYKSAADEWNIWVTSSRRESNLLIGEGFVVPHESIFKAYAADFAASVVGQLGEDKVPSVHTVGHQLSFVFSAISEFTEARVPLEVKKQVHSYIKEGLTTQGRATKRMREKYEFAPSDFKHVQHTAWTTPESRPPRGTVIFTTLLHLLVNTGGRLGAFCPSVKVSVPKAEEGAPKADRLRAKALDMKRGGLRWRDLLFYLLPRKGERPEIVVTIAQRWMKANPDPEHQGATTATLEGERLSDDLTPWLLAHAFAAGVFRAHENIERLLEQDVPPALSQLQVRYKPACMEIPVFCYSTYSTEPLTQAQFYRLWHPVMLLAGYQDPVTVHAVRRAVTNKTESHTTAAQKETTFGHTQSVFNQSYLSSLSSIDIRATYLGEETRDDHIRRLMSVSRSRIPGLPTKLPRQEREECLSADDDLRKLDMELRQLGAHEEARATQLRKEMQNVKRRLKRAALKTHQSQYVEETLSRIEETKGHPDAIQVRSTRRQFRLLDFMPEHKRITAMMLGSESYTRAALPHVVNDLVTLLGQDQVVLHRPDEMPVDGRCPVEECRQALSASRHDIHKCRQRGFDRSRPAGSPSAYCYECFQWFGGGSEWENHCRTHAESAQIECGPIIMRGRYVVSPGTCPFCLENEKLPASERWKQWSDEASLLRHIDVHIAEVAHWPAPCPHPRCKAADVHLVEDQIASHMDFAHDIQGCAAVRCRPEKRKADTPMTGSPPPSKRSRFTFRHHLSTDPKVVTGDDDDDDNDGQLNLPISPESENLTPTKNTTLLQRDDRLEDALHSSPAFPDPLDIADDLSVCSLPSIRELLSTPLRFRSSQESALTNHPSPSLFSAFLSEDAYSDPTSIFNEVSRPSTPLSHLSCPQCGDSLAGSLPPSLNKEDRITSCTRCSQEEFWRPETQWYQRGYPDIDWADLSDRVDAYMPWVEQGLLGRNLPGRDQWIQATEAGAGAFTLYGMNRPTSGYYGERGFNCVMEHITWRLRTSAKCEEDPIVMRHFADYIGFVITPAVFTRLVMEDLTVGAQEAVEVLRQSQELGEYFHPEVICVEK